MRFVRFVCGFFCLCVVGTSFAADLPVQNYPNARVMYQSQAQVDEYILALSSYKKIAGNWRLDRQQRLKGNLARYTLELPERHSASNGFEFYLDQLQNFNFRELFHCKGRDCGTSNSWANNHFKLQQLYGLDQFQQYGAYEVTSVDNKPFFIALYAVQRGNKRVYVQLDVLHVDQRLELGVASNSDSIINALDVNGYYVFPDLVTDDANGNTSIQIKPAHLNALIDALTQHPTLKIALVGHDYAAIPLAQQQQDSLAYANQLKAALQEKGVVPARITTYGMGSLAPAGRGDRSARVEVVKLND